jgi:hypothetical protein
MGWPRRGEVIAVAGLMLGLLVAFFSRAIFRNWVLSAADLLLLSSPWSHDAPPGFMPANRLLSDVVYVFRPWSAFATEALRAGVFPLWNPNNYAGAPLLGNGQSALLYPLSFLFLVLPVGPALLVSAVTRLLVAGLATYLFARVIGVSRVGSAYAGIAFMFSGFLVVWLLFPPSSVALWLPALFLATEAVVRRPTPARCVALAAVTCVQFLGGHPETSLHMVCGVGLYAVWRAAMVLRAERGWRPAAGRVGAFAGALLLGTAAAAIQLVPLAEFILQSPIFQSRVADAPATLWYLPRVRWTDMVALLCPHCFGTYLRGDLPWGYLIGQINFNELNGGYVGVVTLLLAGVAVALGAWRGIDGFFVFLAGLAFGVAHQVPVVYNLVHALPLFRISANMRTILLMAFALAVLAGRGIDRLGALPERRVPAVLHRLRGALVLAALAMAAGVVYVAAINSPESLRARLIPDGYDRLVDMLVHQGAGRVGLLALSGIAIHLVLQARRGRAGLAWLLPAILVADLFAFGRNYNPAIPPRLDFPRHEAIEFVKAQPGLFRILGLDAALPPNTNLAYGLQDVRGYAVVEIDSYLRFLDATGEYPQPWAHFRTLYFSNFASRLVDLLNVRFVLSDRELQHPKLALRFERGIRVYENRAVLPRAFLVYRTRVVAGPAAAEQALRDPGFDPGGEVILEGASPATGAADPAATTRIGEYGPNRVVAEVSSATPAVLVLSDSWFPGWEATLDGAPVPLLRANLALRGVAVPAGQHRVVFRYAPGSVRLGLALSGLAVAVAVGLVAWPRRRPPP